MSTNGTVKHTAEQVLGYKRTQRLRAIDRDLGISPAQTECELLELCGHVRVERLRLGLTVAPNEEE